MENLFRLVNELCKLPNELQWVEFKHNNYDPKMIGQDISALANSAAIYEKNCAYMLWEIDDTTHEIVGREHNLQSLKKGKQELENWLCSLLSLTNLGAILFAKRLSAFPRISRKAIRVAQYRGNNRIEMLKEDVRNQGYVVGFEGLTKYIEALLPSQEVINGALREKRFAYPL